MNIPQDHPDSASRLNNLGNNLSKRFERTGSMDYLNRAVEEGHTIGSDADYNYELNEEREERKQAKMREQKEKERQLDTEKAKEEEVRTAYRFLSKAEKERKAISVGLLAGQSFKLFSSDLVNHFCSDLYVTKGGRLSPPGRHERSPSTQTEAWQ